MGRSSPGLTQKKLKLAHPFDNKLGRALFLKGIVTDSQVTVIDELNSASLQSFAACHALVYIDAATKKCEKGAVVETLLLPR